MVIVPQGTWESGELRLPAGIASMTDGLSYRKDGTCKLPDGRFIELSLKRLPYDSGSCGSDPTAMFSLRINGAAIFDDWDFYSCHAGYNFLAIAVNDGRLTTCTWLGRNGTAASNRIMRSSEYECEDRSDLLK